MSIFDKIASVLGGGNDDDKSAAPVDVKSTVEPIEPAVAEQNETVIAKTLPITSTTFPMAEIALKNAQQELAAWYAYGDGKAQETLALFARTIRNNDEMDRAISNYNLAWFAKQPMSPTAKQELAAWLLNRAKELDFINNLEVWSNIVNNDAETMYAITFSKRT